MNSNVLLIITAVCFVSYIVWEKSASWRRSRRLKAAEKEQFQRSMIESFERLTDALQKSTAASLSDETTKVIAGTMKACETIAASTVELRDEISSFRKLLVSDNNKPDYPADGIIKPPTDEEAERHAMTFQKILEGKSLEQAAQEALEESEKKTMLSAVTMGGVE